MQPALLLDITVYSGKSLPTFRENLQVLGFLTREEGSDIGCPETSVRNCHYTLGNIPEEHRFPFFLTCLRTEPAHGRNWLKVEQKTTCN